VTEFLCGLGVVVLLSATDVDPSHIPVIMRFLFNIYDAETKNEVRREDLMAILKSAYCDNLDVADIEAVLNKLYRIAADR